MLVSQERAGITFAVIKLYQRMSDPSQHSFSKLKRLEFGNMSSEVTIFSDSDWAGDKENEESVVRGSRARGTTPL